MECLVEKETTDFESWRIWSRETDCVEEREWHFKPEVVVMCTVNQVGETNLQNCSFSPKFERDNLYQVGNDSIESK